MKTDYAVASDFDAWISLSREVEHLFGPMADEASFQDALKQAISDRNAFCIRSENSRQDQIRGGIVISEESNEILWFAVSDADRGKGYGTALLDFAVKRLNNRKSMFVQTFDISVSEGKSARKLYAGFGFAEHKKGEINPARVPTVIMMRPGTKDTEA